MKEKERKKVRGQDDDQRSPSEFRDYKLSHDFGRYPERNQCDFLARFILSR